MPAKATAITFWESVNKDGPVVVPDLGQCWVWLGATQNCGYGYFGRRVGGKCKNTLAHRHSYESFKGPIPAGLTIDHLCFNKRCVNPSHLEAVPNGVNNARGNSLSARNARKTHCPKGHPYDAIYSSGGRRCKRCHAERERRRRANL